MAIYDLTKQQVVEYLAEFEEKLPNKGITLYEPSKSFNPHNPDNMYVEATRIIQFLGIRDYDINIDYADLSERGAAGIAHINDLVKKEFHITIDNNTLYYKDKTLRVLAHEICHLYLKLNGIFANFEKIDEAGAELCTIYMGLGLLTLRGYDEADGYLNLEDFCHAFCVVYKTRGMSDEMIKIVVPEKGRQYAEVILQDMAELQKGGLGELVKRSQYSDYNFRRRVRILQLLLDNIPEIKEKHNLQDGVFRNKKAQLRDDKPPIFEMLQRETFVQNSLTDDRLDKCCEKMDELINLICSTMKVDSDKVSEGLIQDVTCPSCGYIDEKNTINSIQVLTCPKCHHYYVWDGQPFKYSESNPIIIPEKRSFWKRLFNNIRNNNK